MRGVWLHPWLPGGLHAAREGAFSATRRMPPTATAEAPGEGARGSGARGRAPPGPPGRAPARAAERKAGGGAGAAAAGGSDGGGRRRGRLGGGGQRGQGRGPRRCLRGEENGPGAHGRGPTTSGGGVGQAGAGATAGVGHAGGEILQQVAGVEDAAEARQTRSAKGRPSVACASSEGSSRSRGLLLRAAPQLDARRETRDRAPGARASGATGRRCPRAGAGEPWGALRRRRSRQTRRGGAARYTASQVLDDVVDHERALHWHRGEVRKRRSCPRRFGGPDRHPLEACRARPRWRQVGTWR